MLKKMPIIFKILICYFQMDCNSSFIVLARTKKKTEPHNIAKTKTKETNKGMNIIKQKESKLNQQNKPKTKK